MNAFTTKLAIAAIATAASLGSAFAGELYNDGEGRFTPIAVTAPVSVAGYAGGGELYPQVDRQVSQSPVNAKAAQPVPSFYALGGELSVPTGFDSSSAINTNLAE